MNWCLVDKIFDNATVAGLLTVLIGGLIGVLTFWKQRRQTKIENLSEQVELLIEKCEDVNLILDRASNTYITLSSKMTKEEFLSALKNEVTIIGKIANEEISQIRAKIKNYTGFYFSDNKVVVNNMISFFEELKKWHTNVIDIVHVGYEFNKRIADNEKFNLKLVQDSAKKFVYSIK